MSEDEFWDVIERVKISTEDWGERPEVLKRILSQLPARNILEFKNLYYAKLVESYRWDLWGAAFTINGGCSDDSFDYWRDFLISEGKSVYENAIKDPESLADLEDIEDAGLEDYRYAIEDAYQAVTGSEFPKFTINYPSEPMGEEWEEEDLLQLFPKLSAKYDNV